MQLSSDGHRACDLSFAHVQDIGVRNRLSLNYSIVFGDMLPTGFYRFGLLLCVAPSTSPPVDCVASLTLLNPGGEHLSSDLIDLPGIYQGFLIFWCVLIGVHCLNWAVYFKYRNELHDMVVVAPILAAISALLNRIAWIMQSQNEDGNPWLKRAQVASYAALCYSFLMLMLMTYGYCILR